MALPEDFSKIYGSTATGGLTPINDTDYAKGWEFVGSNPPTKNDFSYLQNLSDLKSQWLYSNKLQRTDPFGDIKSDGTENTALENLGLGETINKASGAMQKSANGSDISDVSAFRNALQLGTAATRDVNAGLTNGIPDMSSFRGSLAGNGYIKIPIIGAGGGAQTIIIQWGVHSTSPGSNTAYNLVVAFPNSILWATGGRGAPGSNASMNVRPEGTQQIRIQNYAPSGPHEDCLWIAIGY